jgi:two-component system, LytTR family, sensor kinase
MKKYQFVTGALVSFFIASLASFPRLIRYESLDFSVLGENFMYTFFFALLCWLLHQFFLYEKFRSGWLNIVSVKAITAICLGITLSLVYHYLASKLTSSSPFLVESVSAGRRVGVLIFRGLLISSFQFFIAYYLFIVKQNQQRAVENERLKKENLEARLAALKQQISPHFLFNTFNTLSILSRDGKVKEFISNISTVYRYLLQVKENNLVTLEQELTFVRAYVYILSERFEDALNLRFNITAEATKKMLPPLALQMLIENAIKHNVVSTTRPLEIQIFDTDGALVVKNNLQPRISYEESNGQGLYNISERYKLIANTDVVIRKDQEHFVVELPLLTQ